MPLHSQLCPWQLWQQDRGYPACEPPPLISLTGHRAHRALLLPGTTRAHPEGAEPVRCVTPAALPCTETRGCAAPAAGTEPDLGAAASRL